MKPPNLDLNTISTNFKINKHKIRKNFAWLWSNNYSTLKLCHAWVKKTPLVTCLHTALSMRHFDYNIILTVSDVVAFICFECLEHILGNISCLMRRLAF